VITALFLQVLNATSNNAELVMQDKHVDSAKELLGESSKELTYFVGRLLDDITNLKAMLNAMSIGEWAGFASKTVAGVIVDDLICF